MLLVLFTWIYIFFTLTNLGFGLSTVASLKSNSFFICILLGLVATTILATIWAIFCRINWEFHGFIITIQVLMYLYCKEEIKTLYRTIWKSFGLLSKNAKGILLAIAVLILAQSASASHFVDNETYYVQTIKWLTEFGFVKGFANLHLFLGQTSGWHVLQSVFSFSFFGNCFNDLNGFCLVMAVFFGILTWNSVPKNQDRQHLLLALFPIVSLALFPFLSAPSPDFAVYLLSFFVFYYFLEKFESVSASDFNLIFILSSFIIFVKVTALVILLLPLLLFVLHFKKLVSKVGVSYLFAGLIFSLICIKNTILTGLPLFPSNLIAFDLQYTLPKECYQFSFNPAKRYDFFITSQEFKKLNSFSIFVKWLIKSETYSIFNCIIVGLLVGIPLYLKRFLNERKYWIIYGTMVVQVCLLWLTSPHYRFILNYVLFFGLLMLSHFIHTKKGILKASVLSILPLLFFVFFSDRIKSNFQDLLTFKEESFTLKTILYPAENSQLKTVFHETKIGTFRYHSPDASTYIWATGNGNLPCVSDAQIKYLKHKTGYVPQLRTNLLKDGFYSKKSNTP